MNLIQEINSVLDMTEDWDSNWNEVLLHQSEENNWTEKNKIEFLYKKELYLRKTLESLLDYIAESSRSEGLYENVKFIFTDLELGIRSLVIDELIALHKAWVIDKFLDEDIFKKEFDSLFNTLNQEVIKKHFMMLSKEIHLLISIINTPMSPVSSIVLSNLVELIQGDLVHLFRKALFDTNEVTL